MPNPSVATSAQTDGVWLIPFIGAVADTSAQAWIGTGTPEVSNERDEQVVNILGREETVTQSSGVVRLDAGVLNGVLMSRHGLTADQWRNRLKKLVKNQSRYDRIWMVTPRVHYQNVELGSMSFAHQIIGEPGWQASVEFREKR